MENRIRANTFWILMVLKYDTGSIKHNRGKSFYTANFENCMYTKSALSSLATGDISLPLILSLRHCQ